jgi:leucine dehydrogenase
VIAGAANNQLANEVVHGPEVMKRGILYAPDYLINAGGIINCAWERKGYNRKAALNQTENIYHTALAIFARSAAENIPTYLAANQAAELRIRSIKQAGLRF